MEEPGRILSASSRYLFDEISPSHASKERDQNSPSLSVSLIKAKTLGWRARRIWVCARSKNYYLTRMRRPSDDNNYMCN